MRDTRDAPVPVEPSLPHGVVGYGNRIETLPARTPWAFGMDAVALFKQAYLKYWDIAQTVKPPCEWLPYDKYTGVHTNVLMYGFMEPEYTRELVNTVNQYATNMHRLAIWQRVFDGYSDEEQFELVYEFTQMPTYYVLHQPYEFKSRLTHCAVQLCYQVGLAGGALTKADLVDLVQEHAAVST